MQKYTTFFMLLQTIEIPDYPDKILISKARRPVYYVQKGKGLRGKEEIPKSYKTEAYTFKDGFLVKKATQDKVLANPRTAGTARYWVVNFQEIWNGRVSGAGRAAKIEKIKEALRPYISKVIPIAHYPVRIEIELCNTQFNIDASNKGVIYTKVIEDLLVSEGKLVDDSPAYVNDTGRIKLTIVQTEAERKMIVRIYKSS